MVDYEKIYGKKKWEETLDKYAIKGWKPRYIVLHHSATEDNAEAEDLLSFARYHIETNGWPYCGYDWVVESFGGRVVAQEARPSGLVAYAAKGFNRNSIHVCVAGNFDLAKPSLEKWRCAVDLCKKISVTYAIKPENIIGHRTTYDILGVPREKTCPGKYFKMEDFRANVVNLLADAGSFT